MKLVVIKCPLKRLLSFCLGQPVEPAPLQIAFDETRRSALAWRTSEWVCTVDVAPAQVKGAVERRLQGQVLASPQGGASLNYRTTEPWLFTPIIQTPSLLRKAIASYGLKRPAVTAMLPALLQARQKVSASIVNNEIEYSSMLVLSTRVGTKNNNTVEYSSTIHWQRST